MPVIVLRLSGGARSLNPFMPMATIVVGVVMGALVAGVSAFFGPVIPSSVKGHGAAKPPTTGETPVA